ncbi:MAG TPA: hypothetical protein VIT85_05625 [Solirubrobacterales bacterium]
MIDNRWQPTLGRLAPLFWASLVAVGLLIVFPYGFPTYDTRYALVWGNEIGSGLSPDYGAGDPPTPHPLADAWGALVSPLGALGATDATMVVAYLSIGAIAYLVYRLGATWFDRPIGVLAAVLIVTRPPLISNGLRAYVDLPYIALVLAALALESRRPRAGWPVLALLAAAGLLRPEAWLFSAAYLLYMLLELNPEDGRLPLRPRPELTRVRGAALVALAASAPLIWALFDLITSGEPLYSFTATRSRVGELERDTGLAAVVLDGPHRLGEALSRPGIVAAGAGIVLSLVWFRKRAGPGLVAVALAVGAFAILGSSGLAVIARYLMLLSALLCVFAAAAVLGWRLLPGADPWRRRWPVLAALLAVLFIAQAPQQWGYLSDEDFTIDQQARLDTDLRKLAESGAFAPGCGPIASPSDRAVPRLASWLDVRPSSISIEGFDPPPDRGYLLDTRTAYGADHYGEAVVPPGFRPVAGNESFLLYAKC